MFLTAMSCKLDKKTKNVFCDVAGLSCFKIRVSLDRIIRNSGNFKENTQWYPINKRQTL